MLTLVLAIIIIKSYPPTPAISEGRAAPLLSYYEPREEEGERDNLWMYKKSKKNKKKKRREIIVESVFK